MKKTVLSAFVILLYSLGVGYAQEPRREKLQFGDFEHWHTRVVKESRIVGGDSVKVYYIGPDGVSVKEGDLGLKTPWASSNVYAEIMGVTKTNVNVFPVQGPTGKCVQINTSLMSFKAMGMKVNVVTAGAIYTGHIDEPVKDMDDAYEKIDMGIPFTGKPDYLVFDYKATVQNLGTITVAKSFKIRQKEGKDAAKVFILLQKRWEENGKVYAKRVGTGELIVNKTTDWVKNHKLKINYGQPQNENVYSEICRLNSIFHTDNAKGKRVPIQEVGWSGADENPTHVIIYITSGSCGVYEGEVGNSLTVDNVQFEYAR